MADSDPSIDSTRARLIATRTARTFALGAIASLEAFLAEHARVSGLRLEWSSGEVRAQGRASPDAAEALLGAARMAMVALRDALVPIDLTLDVADVTLERLDADTQMDPRLGFGPLATLWGRVRQIFRGGAAATLDEAIATRDRVAAIATSLRAIEDECSQQLLHLEKTQRGGYRG